MKLKTLKDIEGGIDEYYSIFIKNLKKEAIKWVKKFIENREHREALEFQNFFNITKEDLQ